MPQQPTNFKESLNYYQHSVSVDVLRPNNAGLN